MLQVAASPLFTSPDPAAGRPVAPAKPALLAGCWRGQPVQVRIATWLGGRAADNINSPGFGPDGNTCASRTSVASNKGGAPIDGARVGPRETIGTADHSRLIFSVAPAPVAQCLAILDAPEVRAAIARLTR